MLEKNILKNIQSRVIKENYKRKKNRQTFLNRSKITAVLTENLVILDNAVSREKKRKRGLFCGTRACNEKYMIEILTGEIFVTFQKIRHFRIFGPTKFCPIR